MEEKNTRKQSSSTSAKMNQNENKWVNAENT